jgi:prevent-host-death family protein
MSAVIKMRNRRGELVDAPEVSASDAKNGFGQMLDRVAREGRLAITKRDQPCAVLISIDEYRALVAAEQPALESLVEEFDALYARMQVPGAAAAMEKAFAMSPDELGRVAVQEATAAVPTSRVSARGRTSAAAQATHAGRASAAGAHAGPKTPASGQPSMRQATLATRDNTRAAPRAVAAKKVRRARA